MKNVLKKNNCTGCTACKNICPQNAISMIADKEGFLYPIVDEGKCINCGLCHVICPVLNNGGDTKKLIDVYACFNNNDEERLKSSSGGIFSLLAKNILERNGIVFGASFNKEHLVEHIYINTVKDLYRLQGSKYLQSSLGESFKTVEKNLNEGKYVLFSGTPCQIEGLLHYLRKEYDNLFTVDIVCHGVPSPKIWQKYLTSLKSPISKINFRNKANGWKKYNLTISNDNFIVNESFLKNSFFNLFLNNLIVRPSCYECKFKNKYRRSDITLGDFWGINKILPKMDDDKGTSLMIINTCKGNDLFKLITKDITFESVDYNFVLKNNTMLTHSISKPIKRNELFSQIDIMNFDELYKKYHVKKRSFLIRAVSKLKKIILPPK